VIGKAIVYRAVVRPSTHFARSRTVAGPVLELKPADTLEFAFIVGDDSEPRGFGVSSNPELVATNHKGHGDVPFCVSVESVSC
jgi:hypothetical protein